jgi:hypothetical protein
MNPFTLDRGFHKEYIIDAFSSLIWTERYYGDGQVEFVVPATPEMIGKISVGTFLGIEESDEVMILESISIEDYKLKATGISLLSWMNNRFVRASAAHEDKYWTISDAPPGEVLWLILYNMCAEGSPYLDGTNPTGISDPEKLAIPGLSLNNYDSSGDNITVGVPYGPVYNAMKDIATTYQIGMQLILESLTDVSYVLGFRSYKGLDRTSNQSLNPIVRFSPQMDSLTDIKELQSIAAFKTLAYAFAPGNPDGLATTPGESSLTGPQYTGFDLRALLIFADDITTDMVGADPAKLLDILNSRAQDGLASNEFVKAVDGEIVPTNQFKYGIDYNLGDIIEVQGNSGVIQTSRITEYIRSHDATGEKAYPTVKALD